MAGGGVTNGALQQDGEHIGAHEDGQLAPHDIGPT